MPLYTASPICTSVGEVSSSARTSLALRSSCRVPVQQRPVCSAQCKPVYCPKRRGVRYARPGSGAFAHRKCKPDESVSAPWRSPRTSEGIRMHRPVCFQHQMKQAPQKQKPCMPSRIFNFGVSTFKSYSTYTHEYLPVKESPLLGARREVEATSRGLMPPWF